MSVARMMEVIAKVTVIFAVGSLGTAAQPSASKIRVGIQPVMISPLWNAYANNMFRKNGVELEFVTFTTGPAQTAALRGGVVDIGWGAATTFYSIRSGGARVQWIATIGDFNGNDAFVAGPSTGIGHARDLKGKTIALPFGTVVHYPLIAWLNANGVQEREVNLINLAPPQAVAAVNSKTADAVYAWPPFTTEILKRGGTLLARPKDAPGGGWSWVGFAANQDWAEKNVSLLARFLKTLEDARLTIAENKSVIIKTAVQLTGMPVETAEEVFPLVVFPPLRNNVTPGNPMSMCGAKEGQGLSAILAQARDFYVKSGQIKSGAPFEEFLNPSAAAAAFETRCP